MGRLPKIWKDLWVQPKTTEEKRDCWFAKFYFWGMLAGWLSFLSILFPAIAAVAGSETAKIFAVCATITAGTISFLKPQDQKDKFNVAWLLLAKALESNDSAKIDAANARGESIINAEALQKPDEFVGPPKEPPNKPGGCAPSGPPESAATAPDA
jgi:hypothetical protein